MKDPMKLPRAVKTAIDTLEKAGFETYLVGGCVRDHLMHFQPHDFDLTTSALPEDVMRAFQGYQVVETGLRHGTVTVVIENMPLEITTFRVDGGYADHRHPDSVRFTPDLYEDLARRDFTVNAMAYSPLRGLIDPFGGQDDLLCGVIRCVGDARRRFDEDALRVLRALRFASALGFSLEKETAQSVHALAPTLCAVSAERIYAELCKLVCGKNAFAVLAEYPDVLSVFCPKIKPCVGFEQHNRNHPHDVYTHMLCVLDACPPVLPLRLAALFHDIEKPATAAMCGDGMMRFPRHAALSADTAQDILKRLRADNATIELVGRLIRCHDDRIPPERPAVRRLMRRFSREELPLYFALQRADALDHNEDFQKARLLSIGQIEKIAAELQAENACLHIRDLKINGDDLLARGYRGKAIGDALNALLEAVTDESVSNEHDALLSYLSMIEKN